MANIQKAFVTPEVLVWARNLDGIIVEEAAKVASVKVEKYKSWENGEDLPTINQAKKLAKKFRVPFAYFYLPSPPEKYKRPQITDYRAFRHDILFQGHQSRELSFLLRDIIERREVMLELYSELNYDPQPFNYLIDLEKGDEEFLADYIRDLINLTKEKQLNFRTTDKAFKYYNDAFERLGILVFQAADIDLSEMRGISVYEDLFPIIVVNRKDEKSARIFTMFHELVHILSRTPGLCDSLDYFSNKLKNQLEVVCNRIAAKILVPEYLLKQSIYFQLILENGWDDEYIREIARDFAVSREVIIGRMRDIGIINPGFYSKKLQQYSDEYTQYVSNKKKDGFLPPATDIYSQAGKLYASTILNAYQQEIITPKVASGYLFNLRIHHFEKLERWCF